MGIFGRNAVTADEMAAAVKAAVADTTNAITLSGHMAQCERDKSEIRALIANQDAERKAMHAENQVRFRSIQTQNDRIMRVVWMAMGAGAIISFLLSAKGSALISNLVR